MSRMESAMLAGRKAGETYNAKRVEAGLSPEVYNANASDWHDVEWETFLRQLLVPNTPGLFAAFTDSFVAATVATCATRDKALRSIARDMLGLAALDARNSDALDFKEQSVWSIREALEAAYEAGRASAKGAKP